MKLQKGDRVRFLNEAIEGTVAAVHSQGRVEVIDIDGFTHMTDESLLVKIEFTLQEDDLNEKEEAPVSKKSSAGPVVKSSIPIIASIDDDQTIYAAIRLLNEKSPLTTDIELYLVNNTDFTLAFSCTKRWGELRVGLTTAVLNSHKEMLLGVFSQDEIHRFEGFEFQFIFFRSGEFRPRNPDTKILRFSSSDFVNTDYRQKLFDRDDTILLMPLYELKSNPEIDLSKLIERFRDDQAEAKKRSDIQKNKGEKFVVLTRHKIVDLHIEELVKDHSGMNNAQIISYQLNYFMKEMDQAVLDHLHKITFIHGVGNGVLRSSIREELKRFPHIRYYDAPADKYGNGATEVEFV